MVDEFDGLAEIEESSQERIRQLKLAAIELKAILESQPMGDNTDIMQAYKIIVGEIAMNEVKLRQTRDMRAGLI